MKFQDYYQTLGIPREASADDIKRAYRKLARRYHPDINKEKGAEERFKAINEAHEVLANPETRKRYDELGANWREGQEFRPPPGWEQFFSQGGQQSHAYRRFQGGEFGQGGFSDFFEALFGQAMGGRARSQSAPRAHALEAELAISIEEAFRGTAKTFTFHYAAPLPHGEMVERKRTLKVQIPPRTRHGAVLRIGGETLENGERGPDLLLHITLNPDPRYRVTRSDLTVLVDISPAQAALGGKVEVNHPLGAILVTIPAGAQSGQRLRLRGKGLPVDDGSTGDAYAELRIVVPRQLSDRERTLYGELATLEQSRIRGGRTV